MSERKRTFVTVINAALAKAKRTGKNVRVSFAGQVRIATPKGRYYTP